MAFHYRTYHDVDELKVEVDHLERMLYGVLERIELKDHQIDDDIWNEFVDADPDLSYWWEQKTTALNRQRKLEAEFLRKKNLRASALAKLTKEEREELGLGNS